MWCLTAVINQLVIVHLSSVRSQTSHATFVVEPPTRLRKRLSPLSESLANSGLLWPVFFSHFPWKSYDIKLMKSRYLQLYIVL